MGRGLSRAYVAAVGMAQSMLTAMENTKTRAGENIFSAFDIQRAAAYAQRHLAKMAGGGRLPSKYTPHQGAKECARRVRQGEAGTCYVHGWQYPKA